MNELDVRLDFNQKTPLADQIREEVRRLIHNGVLQPGAPLPTVRELAAQLRVNFNTAARAYRALDIEGLITTRQGRGTYVRQEAVELKGAERETDMAKQLGRLLDNLITDSARLGIPQQMLKQAILERIMPPGRLEGKRQSSRLHMRKYRSFSRPRQVKAGTVRQNPNKLGSKRSPLKRNIHPTMFHVKQ